MTDFLDALDHPRYAFRHQDELAANVEAMSPADRARVRESGARLLAAGTAMRSKMNRAQAWFTDWFANRLIEVGLFDSAREDLSSFVDTLAVGREATELDTRDVLLLLAELELAHGNGGRAAELAHQTLRGCEAAEETMEARQRTEGEPTERQRAERQDERQRTEGQRADAYGVLARVALELGNVTQARELATRQQRLAQQSGEPISMLKALLYKAELLIGQDRPRAALDALDDHRGDRDPRIEVVRGVAMLSLALFGDLDPGAARDALQTAVTLPGIAPDYRLRADLGLLDLALSDGDLAAAAPVLDEARRLVGDDCTTMMGLELESLAAWELRLRSARDPVQRRQLENERQRLQHAFESLLQAASAFPEDDGQAFLSFNYRRRVVGELIEYTNLLDPDDAATKAADLLLEAESLSSVNRQAQAPRVRVADLRARMLGQHDAVALFLMSPETSHLVLITADRCELYRLPGWWAVRGDIHAANRVLDEVADSPDDDHTGSLEVMKGLGQAFLPAGLVEALRRCDVVTIADLGTLYGIPWECLALDDGSLLGEDVAINNLSSLAWAVQRAARQPAPTTDPVLDVVVALGGQDSPEAATTHVVDSLTPYYTAGCHELVGEAVTLEHLAALPPATVLQIVAHGVTSDDPTVRGALEIPEGTLEPDAVASLHPDAAVVVLSSCRAGRTRLRLGEDPANTTLGGRFLRAGVPTIVQARCDLWFQAHLRLLQQLHRRLVAGERTAIALRDARHALRDASLAERLQHGQVQVFGCGQLAVATKR